MREVQSTEVKARLPHFLDVVEQGEIIIITRHGHPVAHLIPAPKEQNDHVRQAVAGIMTLRGATRKFPVSELLNARHEGHRF